MPSLPTALLGTLSGSIVAQPDKGLLGSAQDGTSDSFSEAHIEARGAAMPAGTPSGCSIQTRVTRGAISTTKSRTTFYDDGVGNLGNRPWVIDPPKLVSRHWIEIVAVAKELLRCQVLDETEAEILADGAAGDPECDSAPLAMYRKLKEGAR
jgi:hypothetical protein